MDGGLIKLVNGYCTPDGGTDCAPQALPFGITLGGTTFNSFILNGNGTLTLGDTAIDWTSVANSPPSLAGFTMPIFSPHVDNTIVLMRNDFDISGSYFQDTMWAASVTVTPDSLTAYWFPCYTAIFCGTQSLPAEDYGSSFLTLEEVRERQTWNMFGLTLTDLGNGFQLDYFYNPYFLLDANFQPYQVVPNGTYGFNLPGTASLQATGPLVDRSWTFTQSGAVPEPGTWLTMLLGFAVIGAALRRRARREPLPIAS